MTTIYVDSCKAWGTVVGGFVANILLGGLGKSYGLIKEAYQEVFNCGAAPLLLAGGLIYTLMYCNALGVHFASQRFGRRKVVLIGAFGTFLSLMLAAFATNIILWVIAVGVGVGASLSCVYFSIFSVVGQCFKRYIGMANGLSVAGVSIGQMAFPALITYLDQAYGTRLSTTIVAVFCLHLVITAVLMPQHIVDGKEQVDDKPKPVGDDVQRKQSLLRRGLACVRRRRRRPSSGDAGLYHRQETTETVAGDEHPVDASPLLPKVTGDGDGGDVELVCIDTTGIGCQPKGLTNTLLVIYIIAKMFADVGDVSVSFIAPSHGTKLGFSQEMVSFGITFSGIFDLVARLGIGWLTDRPYCAGRRGLLLGVVWLVEGVNALAFSWLNYFAASNSIGQDPPRNLLIAYFFCFAVHGITSGTAMTQMVVVLTDWVGQTDMPKWLAITMLVLGIVISPGQYLMGYLADRTHEYVLSLQLCCFILILAGFLLLLEFPARFYFRHRHRGRSSDDEISMDSKNRSKAIDKKHVWEVVNSDVETTLERQKREHDGAGNGRHSGDVGGAGDIV